MKEIQIKSVDETIYHHVCENGLNIYIWVNDKVSSVNMSLVVKYGSVHTEFISGGKKYEVPNGLAHFLEHVNFNESNDYSAHEFFLKTGAEVNAFTTFDFTNYYVIALDKIEENLIHLLDFVQIPYFTKDLINKEKGIIREEAKMGQDNPDTVSYFGIFENLFNSCKYKNLITGNLLEINKISLEHINLVFENFYHPENMALFITGNVNPHEIQMIVENNQNKKDFGKFLKPKVIVPKEKAKVLEKKRIVKGNVTEPRLKLGVKIPRKNLENFTDFDIRLILNLILNINFGTTSDLKDYLLENHLASKIYSSADIYDDFVVIVVASNTRFPEEVSKVIKDKLKNLKVENSEFNRKIKALVATYVLNYDSVERVNDILQEDYVNYGYIIDDAKIKYENLTIKKAEKLISLLDFENITEYIMEVKEEK